MSAIAAAAAERTLARVLPPWWLFLSTGVGWMLVGLIVLRFDYTSVSAISILFGIVAIAAGVLESAVITDESGNTWLALHAWVGDKVGYPDGARNLIIEKRR